VTTKGFRDLLRIGNQSRPNIFALNVRRAEVLYESVLEVDERVTLHGYTYDPDFEENAPKFDEAGKLISDHKGEFVRGISGEAVQILRKPGASPPSSDSASTLFQLALD
jgi:5-oxoprolinase (ATP-hydrolysing)